MNYSIGVDVGGTKILSVLAGFCPRPKILREVRVATQAASGRETILSNIYLTVDDLAQSHPQEFGNLEGIGIGIAGPVDSLGGRIINCANLPGCEGLRIRETLESRYGVPVTVENDAHMAALAEGVFGAGKDMGNVLYVSLGTAIGAGIIINGRLYKGSDGTAGELSHVKFEDGKSLYRVASGRALNDLFSIRAEELQEGCRAGDANAERAFSTLVNCLGIGIANVVTMLNPAAVVVGGGLASLGEFFLDPLEATIRENAFSTSGKSFRFLRTKFENSAGALGAAYATTAEGCTPQESSRRIKHPAHE